MKYITFSVFRLFFKALNKIKRISNNYNAVAQGMSVGENTMLVGSQDFGSEPYLIKIGGNCLITDGVRFITHDGSIQVPYIRDGYDIMSVYSKKNYFGKICIGNNVFIGVSTIILPNTSIGDNTIIAAGSVVKGSFKSNCVIGGNPAKVICTLDAYYEKNIGKVIDLSSSKNRKKEIIEMALFDV